MYWCMHRTSLNVAFVLCSVANLMCYWNQFDSLFFIDSLQLPLNCYCCARELAPPIWAYISCQQHILECSVRTVDRILFTLQADDMRCGVGCVGTAPLQCATIRIFEHDATGRLLKVERGFSWDFVGGADAKINTKFNLLCVKSVFHSTFTTNRFVRGERRKFSVCKSSDGMNNNQIMKSFSNYIE